MRVRTVSRLVPLFVVALAGSAFVNVAAGAEPRPFPSVGVSPEASPVSLTNEVTSVKEIDAAFTGQLDFATAMIDSDQRLADGNPLRFAVPVAADYTLDNSGNWEALKDGSLVWRLRIESPGALSLNLGFTEWSVPQGVTMTILTVDGSEVIRPFSEKDNNAAGQLWTPVLNSDEVVIELAVPEQKLIEQVRLRLGAINAGFRSLNAAPLVEEGRGTSGSCNVDVACPQGDPWRDQINAVGAYTVSGIDTCSGSMVNNVRNDRTPYFLTAFHCGVDAADAASVVIFWNFQNSTCRTPGTPESGNGGDGSFAQFSSGTTFRAGLSASDFTLLQVNTPPNPAWGVTFAGWSREGLNPASGAGVHHPGVAEKRISFYDTNGGSFTGTHGSSWPCSTAPGPGDNTHISVYWSLGITEGGSSGSPLYDANKRIIGQLHGGPSSCSATGANRSDCYGRVSRSFTGNGTPSTRLSDWLDPDNTGVLVLDTLGRGLDVSPTENTTHQGIVGGPFTPASVAYTINNSTPSPAGYSVTIVGGGTAPISLVGASSGTIPGSSSAMITVQLDAAATSLAAGIYATTVRFEDLTNGVTYERIHTLEVGLTGISVTPASALTGGGPLGGPFNATRVYTVTSTQPSPVNVSVSSSATWFAVDGSSSSSFTLSGVGDSRTVTVGFTSAANSLALGTYNGTTTFTNTSGGSGSTTRGVTLEVGSFTYTYSGPGISIPDNNPTGITSTLDVADSFCVGDVNASVNITHTFRGDLIVELTSPSGTTVRLHNRTGSSADNLIATYDQGVFNPDGPGAMTNFNNQPSLGTWTLKVIDAANIDVGTLNSWSLKFAAAGQTCPPVASNFSVNVPDTVASPIALVATSFIASPLTYTIQSLPTSGTLRDPNAGVILAAPYTLASGGNIVLYTPASLYIGPDSFTFSAADLLPSNTATASIQVGIPVAVADWNMDTNPGFTLGAGWAYGDPLGTGGDPNNGFTGTNVLGYNLAGAYANNIGRSYATSPVLNLTGYINTSLSFRRWLGVESTTFDDAGIEVSVNGGSSWTVIWENPAATINETAWSLQTYNLSAIADGQATVQLRWYLGPTDGSVTFSGWNLDDILITAVAPPAPPTACPGDANGDGAVTFDDVTSVLSNFGVVGMPGNPGDLSGDANGDGAVNFDDVTTILSNFGIPCP